MESEKVVWNEINTDFDPEEETANFGTRHALEAEGNLYEVGYLSFDIRGFLIQLFRTGGNSGHVRTKWPCSIKPTGLRLFFPPPLCASCGLLPLHLLPLVLGGDPPPVPPHCQQLLLLALH